MKVLLEIAFDNKKIMDGGSGRKKGRFFVFSCFKLIAADIVHFFLILFISEFNRY